ncbi:VOC family protein [Haladaptatus sp.]|uniref:VOC family protein n=1 Tax=Haladaptatus sp. TaxID=1973141 RepID=UPI003C5F71F5
MTGTEFEIVPETRVGRVALRVTDLDRTSRFYESVIGLERQRESGGIVVLGAGDRPLLELVDDPDASPRTAPETGLFHTAFLVPSRRDLADVLVRIEEKWELSGASDHRVSEALYLTDPEGNGVEVYRDRPREEWPTDGDGHVEMDTLPLDIDELRTESTGRGKAPPETVVGHVHLEVSSIPAAREFYAGTLGLRVRQEFGPSVLFLAADGYHHHVGVNTWNGRSEPATGRGLAWFELLVPDRKSLERIRERCIERGIGTTPTERGFEVSDADTITVRLSIID